MTLVHSTKRPSLNEVLGDLKAPVEAEGGYLIINPGKTPLEYYRRIKGVGKKEAHSQWKADGGIGMRDFYFLFPPELTHQECIFDNERVKNALEGIPLKLAIAKLEAGEETFQLLYKNDEQRRSGVIGLPYYSAPGARHAEASLDISCEHEYGQSDVRFHYHGFGRENHCKGHDGSCSLDNEIEKSRRFIEVGIELLKTLKEIYQWDAKLTTKLLRAVKLMPEKPYTPFDIDALAERHYQLTEGLEVVRR